MSEIQKKSPTEKKAEEGVTDLKSSLKQMPFYMRTFSLSMRSLYTDVAVGTSSETAQKFRKLRDDTKNDAAVYLQCILPVSTKFVSNLKEYFDYYDTLSFDEWVESLPDIIEESKTYKELAEMVMKMHEEIIVPLKKRQHEAKIIMKEFTNLQEQFESKVKELEAKASHLKGWAFALSFVPYVNVIATPILKAYAEANLSEAVANQEESKIHEAGALVVAECLIPALTSFIDGLRKAAGFFQVMEIELQSFQGKAEKGVSSPKKLYYNTMKGHAKEMKSHCQTFYAVLPDVRTDFEAIPTEGTDQNYVDKWLERKKAEIAKRSIYQLLQKIWSKGQ